MSKVFLALCLLLSVHVCGQNMKMLEAVLDSSYARVIRSGWMGERAPGDDAIADKNEAFQDTLLAYTSRYPVSLRWPFTGLKTMLTSILTSADGLFRIYSWDDYTGGTMRYYRSVFQYRYGLKVYSCLMPHLGTSAYASDMGYAFSDLYTVKGNAQTYYLATYVQAGSTQDYVAGIRAFAVINGVLVDTALIIKTKSGMSSNISYGYKRSPKSAGHKIYYNDKEQTIYVPVTTDSALTDDYVMYHFNGDYFEKVEE